MIAIAAEAVGQTPQPFTKVLIIVTLGLGVAVRQHHLCAALRAPRLYRPESGCVGLEFPRTEHPGLLGLRLFRLHLRNGVRDVRRDRDRDPHAQDRWRSTASPHSPSTSACSPSPSTCSRRAARCSPFPAARRRGCAPRPGSRRRSAPRPPWCRPTPARRKTSQPSTEAHEEGAIFGDRQIARVASRIGPGEQQGAGARQERGDQRSRPIARSGHGGAPKNGRRPATSPSPSATGRN